MTDNQKEQITNLREGGLGYGKIAIRTGLTKEAVRYFCKTHDLEGVKSPARTQGDVSDLCRFCNKPITSTPGKRQRLYCSDECRRLWWKAHPEKGKPREKSIHVLVCKFCGKTFTSWGEHGRKFCSHECYIKSRFGVKP